MAGCGNATQLRDLFIEEIERGGVQTEEFGHLPEGAVQRVAQVQRFRQRLGDRVQHHEFPIAAPDYLLRLFTFGDVQEETLIGGHVSRGIPYGYGRLQHGAELAILAPHFELEIRNRTVLLQQSLKPLAIGGVLVERRRNINGHQLLAGLIAGHAQQGFVKIEKPSLRRGDKHAFLYVGDKRAILFLRPLAFRNVLKHVNGAELPPARVRERRVGHEEVPRKPGIGSVAFTGDSFAIGAITVGCVLGGKKFLNIPADQSAAPAAQKLLETLVAAQYAPLGIVNQDGVANGNESVFPLLLSGCDLLKQTNILQRHPQQVGNIHKVGDFVGVKARMRRRAYRNDSQGAVLPRKGERYQRFQSCFVQPLACGRVPFIFRFQKLAFFFQNMLRPRFHGGYSGMLRKEGRRVAHRCPGHQVPRIALALFQPHDSVRSPQAFHQMRKDLVNHLLHGKSLRAGRSQQSQPAQLVIQFLASRLGFFQHGDHHGDSQGHSEKMIKRDTQQKVRMLQPKGTVQPMQANQEKNPGKKLRAVPSERHGRSQEQETGKKANCAFKYGSFPMQGSKLLRPSSLHIVDRSQNQADQWKYREDSSI